MGLFDLPRVGVDSAAADYGAEARAQQPGLGAEHHLALRVLSRSVPRAVRGELGVPLHDRGQLLRYYYIKVINTSTGMKLPV